MPMLPAAERPRLTLEDYIVFFTTRSGGGLNVHHLNDIIYMHGFAKLHRAPKVHLSPFHPVDVLSSIDWVSDHWRLLRPPRRQPAMVDALRSVELMRPRRSTVPLNATAPPPGTATAAAAVLSAEEVTRGIEDLGWRECPVGSILSVRAGMRSPAAAAAEAPMPICAIAPGSAERISPPILVSASPLPPALPAAARRKRYIHDSAPTSKKKKVLKNY
jgi:hypothetical protein